MKDILDFTEMDPKEIIARRVSLEIRPKSLVNLGIGIPTLVSDHLDESMGVFFQSENGVVGLGHRPPEGMTDRHLTDAGGTTVSAVPGASIIDSAFSFGLIRGGHLDLTVLGGLQVDARGHLANWMIPGEFVPGMGGAMDLVTGARKVIVAMMHTAKGRSKIVPACDLPVTSQRRVDLIVTELGVMQPRDDGLHLLETGPGVTVEQVQAATTAELIVTGTVPEMDLSRTI
ncbi:3-oxoacid CoA-transferase subunit B [Salipiger mucosus]|uniref:Acetyl-CoA:acetoacetyl-CoA transferase, beta subunit n=1 Tax=Salipiger mucosus DSM 16094 TaxID=1123237 RepID=S9S9S6_9RHOB|nr:3-oxoacid CoA-transferase subunit B [Salipiger mucosus]EPX83014.1 Acetyl-CoA:acetoacetyl-CoA transferase, beta subunit [Salipiger mucosus DSM 16094]